MLSYFLFQDMTVAEFLEIISEFQSVFAKMRKDSSSSDFQNIAEIIESNQELKLNLSDVVINSLF